jgi:uncharacterized protein YdeI (YjbR/CyaY-like superfamily)
MAMARFFADPAELREWFQAHHLDATELVIGFHKRGSGNGGITWSEAVDEALCVGWIDGVRRRIDDARYEIRFTPRKGGSIWSAVNIAKMSALTEQGRMRPAGIAAFERRTEGRSRIYSHERSADAELDAAEQAQLESDGWAYFQARAPSYRRAALHWIVSAKRPETRARRLATLIADNSAERDLKHLTRR